MAVRDSEASEDERDAAEADAAAADEREAADLEDAAAAAELDDIDAIMESANVVSALPYGIISSEPCIC